MPYGQTHIACAFQSYRMWRAGNKTISMTNFVVSSSLKRSHSTCSQRILQRMATPMTSQWLKASTPLCDCGSGQLGHAITQMNPVKNFSVSTIYQSQSAVAVKGDPGNMNDPSPQGIQGDDCVHFRLWMESCQRYGLPGCDEQANHIVSGRKTISEVFQEQERIIRDIARNYSDIKKSQDPVKSDREICSQGVQEGYEYSAPFDCSDSCVQGVQGLDLLHGLVNVASPQGIQGDECVQFRLWLENCHRFGISGECEQQLHNIKSGRKNLTQIFEEQDTLIRQIVQEYRSKSS